MELSPKRINSLLASLSAATKRLRPLNSPTHIYLEVTNRCNLSCVMCGRTHDRRYRNQRFLGDMPLKLVKQLDGFYSRSSYVIATGLGEPFLNPEFIEILRHLKKKEAIVSLTSNGTFLDEDQAKAVVEARVDRIVFSIDSPDPETFRQIRIGADLTQVLGNIERLARMRAASGDTLPYLILEIVAMAKNFHQLPQVAELAHQLGFNEVIVQNLFKHFAPGYDSFYKKNRLSALSPEKALSHWNEFEDRLRRYSISLYSPFQAGGIHDYLQKSGTDEVRDSRTAGSFLGYIDAPKPMEQKYRSLGVVGWALGVKGFPHAEISLESATDSLHVPVSATIIRNDVLSSLPPNYPREARCGFHHRIDVSHLEPGIYTLSLRVRETREQSPKILARQHVLLSDVRALRMYCSQPWSTIYVTWDGQIRTCCFNEYLLGNLEQASVSEIWKGRRYRDLRRSVVQGQVLNECADCLAGKSTPNDIVDLRDLLKSIWQ